MKAINPFKPKCPQTGYSYIVYNSQVEEYKEFTLAYNVQGSWDIIKDGVCISQRVTKRGSKGFIDLIYSAPEDWFVQRALSFLSVVK